MPSLRTQTMVQEIPDEDLKPWTHYRALVASLSRDRKPDDPELLEARAKLQAARHRSESEQLVDSIRRAVEATPPLPEDAKRRIAAILTRSASRSGGDAR